MELGMHLNPCPLSGPQMFFLQRSALTLPSGPLPECLWSLPRVVLCDLGEDPDFPFSLCPALSSFLSEPVLWAPGVTGVSTVFLSYGAPAAPCPYLRSAECHSRVLTTTFRTGMGETPGGDVLGGQTQLCLLLTQLSGL